jgi:hypothetical protein
MDGEIPHVSPTEGNLNKRYYKANNSNKILADPERELFDCAELVCGTLLSLARDVPHAHLLTSTWLLHSRIL